MTSTTDASTHRLSALWFADVVGYSTLAASDEPAALRLVRLLQQISKTEVDRADGRVIKHLGDGLLAEFGSADAAVETAIAVRDAFETRAVDFGFSARLRIGVHVGDIVYEPGGDIYGNGVNVAARLQQVAEPGEVVASEDVWRQLRQRPKFRFQALGRRSLKGQSETLRLFAVSRSSSSAPARPHLRPRFRLPAAAGRAHLFAGLVVLLVGASVGAFHVYTATPTVRSIAVLPFDNMSGDSAMDEFALGITEDITTQLAKVASLNVRSRTSVMGYRGTTKPMPQIGRELNAVAVLEGSVRRAGTRLRITTQLIHTPDDRHLWADNFDRDMQDVFAVQAEIALQVVEALNGKLTADERRQLGFSGSAVRGGGGAAVIPPTNEVAAYDLLIRGRAAVRRGATAEARQLLAEAIELDSLYAAPYAWMSLAYTTDSIYAEDEAQLSTAALAAVTATRLAPRDAVGYYALAEVRRLQGYRQEAVAAYDRALEISPHDTEIMEALGRLLVVAGDSERATELLSRAAVLRSP